MSKTDQERIDEVREVMAAIVSAVSDDTRYEMIRPGRFRNLREKTEIETNYTNGEAKVAFFGYLEREPAGELVIREKNEDILRSLQALIPAAFARLVVG